jgi:hypothetical protein
MATIYKYFMFENTAYAKLNVEFDRELFIQEYDQHILSVARPIHNGYEDWVGTRQLNQTWNMVDPLIYDQCNVEDPNNFNAVIRREREVWRMAQLMYTNTQDTDIDSIRHGAQHGGTFVRNMTLDRVWLIKPEFKNLEIVRWILRTLPFRKIVSMHCVSLEPGNFASIHRDDRHDARTGQPNAALNNGVRQKGFVVITLNLSDGGVPLYWALDGSAVHTPIKTNDPCYLISDWFLHGVPVCTSRRRQVRITGIPTDRLINLIDADSAIRLPENFVYDTEPNLYPG